MKRKTESFLTTRRPFNLMLPSERDWRYGTVNFLTLYGNNKSKCLFQALINIVKDKFDVQNHAS